jgi:hypothetical protein
VRTRHHGVRWKGFSPEGALDDVDLSTPSEDRTRALRQGVNYMCAYIPDSNNPVYSAQRATEGVSGIDADKQAWLDKYSTGPSHDSTHSAQEFKLWTRLVPS